MEEHGQARPGVTIFPPPQSRQSGTPRPADWDRDLDYPLPTSSGLSSAQELQLLEEKIKSFDAAKKKIRRVHKQLQQQFLKEQERKTMLRKKKAEQFEKTLEAFDRRNAKVLGPSAPLPADQAEPEEPAADADRKNNQEARPESSSCCPSPAPATA
ncbi:uncharacterized protein LOC130259751 isoform X2 [Oenanthe melanoleuca]|uniref:uncharacterized protein LOC130259751 isoform X2 n=1 Tax=Oenanthe melanoleuca TaxID=2939378 RepID=UPI0024C19981|nr:uncharacterized protein LOC130259751 isoform X2 [Oenanthe melanoleuca]